MWDKQQTVTVFGEVLKARRLRAKLTQDALAALAETERSHISSLERAEKGPTLATILVLANALGVPAADLVGEVEARLKRVRAKRAGNPTP